jgi:hypothetical protein
MHALRMAPDASGTLVPAAAPQAAPAPPVAPASVADERECGRCHAGRHAPQASYCWNCGEALPTVTGR